VEALEGEEKNREGNNGARRKLNATLTRIFRGRISLDRDWTCAPRHPCYLGRWVEFTNLRLPKLHNSQVTTL